MRFLRIIITALLIATLPVQVLASWAPAASCNNAHAHHQDHSHAGQGHYSHHGDSMQHDDGLPTDTASGHSCCHQVFSGVTTTDISGTPVTLCSVTARLRSLATLYIPELPQRPPRS